MALNSLFCADVPLSNYSLTQAPANCRVAYVGVLCIQCYCTAVCISLRCQCPVPACNVYTSYSNSVFVYTVFFPQRPLARQLYCSELFQNSFETVLFPFHFLCADGLSRALYWPWCVAWLCGLCRVRVQRPKRGTPAWQHSFCRPVYSLYPLIVFGFGFSVHKITLLESCTHF